MPLYEKHKNNKGFGMRQLVAFLFILTLSACQTQPTEQDKFSWHDASVIELQNAMTNGDLSAEQLTQYYLQRINTHNRQGANLRAVNSVNGNALTDARRLDAGAIILGKANLSEWANFRSTRSSSGWSAIGGQAVNPYNTTRSTCGSSADSATAVAAGWYQLLWCCTL